MSSLMVLSWGGGGWAMLSVWKCSKYTVCLEYIVCSECKEWGVSGMWWESEESGNVTEYSACKDGFLGCILPLWNVLSISGSNDCNSLGFPVVMHQKALIVVILA